MLFECLCVHFVIEAEVDVGLWAPTFFGFVPFPLQRPETCEGDQLLAGGGYGASLSGHPFVQLECIGHFRLQVGCVHGNEVAARQLAFLATIGIEGLEFFFCERSRSGGRSASGRGVAEVGTH